MLTRFAGVSRFLAATRPFTTNGKKPIITPDQIDADDPNKGYKLPKDLIDDGYYFWYMNPKNVKWLDKEAVVNFVLCGQAGKLEESVVTEIDAGARVLQQAATYGNLIPKTAAKIGPTGFFDVVDIVPAQIKQHSYKVGHLDHVRLRLGDCQAPRLDGEDPYDVTFCFLLFHEITRDMKYKVMDATLDATRPGGKAIFVDYYRPPWYNPMRSYLWLKYLIFERNGFDLFQHELEEYASPELHKQFHWNSPETFFGGMFQKVVAIRKEDTNSK